ncbi:MAG: cytochrome c oxidase subunit 3 [Methylophilaceae bacterium]|nr:MAG: cytochrome c oxidase subunit 3 [Methylophilaceae bacterium]
MSQNTKNYYLPGASFWPLIASIALFLMAAGFSMSLNDMAIGTSILIAGGVVFAYLLFGWFADVVKESVSGFYNKQVDASFRWSMGWFIFSEVMFFASFFGALFYIRNVSLDWIEAGKVWPDFVAVWPTAGPAATEALVGMGPWGLPAINTVILLISGATLTYAHWGLMKDNRKQTIIGLLLTIALGVIFLYLQVHEYAEAAFTMAGSGIYGSTFYLLTGFHGLHVTMGTIMLAVILFRIMKGHFDSHNHFGFEAVAWYWHFVDVVWLLLFIFVYWL